MLVPPFYENLGKRLIKSPKLYLLDSGFACHLLGIESESEWRRSPLRGVVFEGFIASEIVKSQLNRGRRRELYYFRDQQGLEVDFVVPVKSGLIQLVEAKASATVHPQMAQPMQKLAAALSRRRPPTRIEMTLVHETSKSADEARSVIAPGVRAQPWPKWVRDL